MSFFQGSFNRHIRTAYDAVNTAPSSEGSAVVWASLVAARVILFLCHNVHFYIPWFPMVPSCWNKAQCCVHGQHVPVLGGAAHHCWSTKIPYTSYGCTCSISELTRAILALQLFIISGFIIRDHVLINVSCNYKSSINVSLKQFFLNFA